jgi:large subunit ribosomal protein L25
MPDTLALESRTPGKTKDVKAVRAAGKIPGVLYGRGNEPVAFQVDRPALREALSGDSTVLKIEVPGRKGDVHAVLKDYQLDPVRDTLIHIDLLEISMTERLVANVNVRVEGEAPGVKDGGVLDQPTFQVEVEALPSDLPSELIVDVSGLEEIEAEEEAEGEGEGEAPAEAEGGSAEE